MNLQKAFDDGFEAVKAYIDRELADIEAAAERIGKETSLRLDAALSDLKRCTADLELRFEHLERAHLDHVPVADPVKAEKPRIRVPAGSARS